MAWHPLLPPERFDAVAEQRIYFLRIFAEKASELIPAPPPREEWEEGLPRAGNPARMAAAAALTSAAEIAFLSNRTSDGRQLVRSALDMLLERSINPIPRLALLGAISQQIATTLSYSGIWLRAGHRSISGQWEAGAGIADHTAGMLLAAALASGDKPERIELLTSQGGDLNDAAALGLVTLVKAPEADLLPLFGFARAEDGRITDSSPGGDQRELGWAAAVALVQSYAGRVRTLHMDQARWEPMRHRAPLLDWPLLTLVLGLRRLSKGEMPDELVKRCGQSGLVHSLAGYLRDLANEIDGEELGQGSRGRPISRPPSQDYVTPPEYQHILQSI